MIKKLAITAGVAVLAVCQASAIEFSFTYSDGLGTLANGYLYGSDLGSGRYNINTGFLSVTSGPVAVGNYTLVGNPMAPFASISRSGSFVFDDVVFGGATPTLSSNGLLFAGGSTSKPTEFKLFSKGVGSSFSFFNGRGIVNGALGGTLTMQAGSGAVGHSRIVPEPFTASLGLASVGLFLRRRKQAKRLA